MIKDELRIYIADDYLLIREGIKNIINNLEKAIIVGESNSLTNLGVKIKDCKPDIILLELNLCDRPVKDILEEVRTVLPQAKVLVVSDCTCELPIIMAIRAGVAGFIKKNLSEEELVKAIYSVSSGVNYFTPDITQILVNGYLSNNATGIHFSDREMEVLRYICKGRSNEQMAELLFISEKTVATHRKNIMKKAGVKKTSDLIIWALDNKILQN